jgi:hypothetical protein
MNYNEKAKELNTLLRIIDSTIMTISLGIVAYSLSNFNSKENYKLLLLLYISWVSLVVSFFTALSRFHHLVRVLGRNAVEQLEVEINKKDIRVDEQRIRATNKKSAWLYRIMLTTFCLGIVFYGLFKIINLN